MRKLLALLTPGLLLAATALPADAAIYSTSFSGMVVSQTGTSSTVGSTVAGSFTYSTEASRCLNFTIAGLSATAPFTSQATTSPASTSNPYEAIFQALPPSAQTNSSNASFTLDLLAFNTFTSCNALTVLTTPPSATPWKSAPTRSTAIIACSAYRGALARRPRNRSSLPSTRPA